MPSLMFLTVKLRKDFEIMLFIQFRRQSIRGSTVNYY